MLPPKISVFSFPFQSFISHSVNPFFFTYCTVNQSFISHSINPFLFTYCTVNQSVIQSITQSSIQCNCPLRPAFLQDSVSARGRYLDENFKLKILFTRQMSISTSFSLGFCFSTWKVFGRKLRTKYFVHKTKEHLVFCRIWSAHCYGPLCHYLHDSK